MDDELGMKDGADKRAGRASRLFDCSIIRLIGCIVHCSPLIVPLSILATGIETTDWGYMWKRPDQWPQSIDETRTPGSDSCLTTRILIPHVYAFLDGYDTRAYVPDHSGSITTLVEMAQQAEATETNSPERAALAVRTNVTARLVAWPQMLERKDALVAMNLGTNTVWGSSAMEELFRTNGAPLQTDFGWTRNPTDKFYTYRKGSGWMPCFRTLYPGTFANEWHGDWCGGIVPLAINEGWGTDNFVSLCEPYTEGASSPTAFSGYVEEAIYDYHATLDMEFDDVIEDTFDAPDVFVESTYRLWYPLFATASRALALHDRTYHIPEDLVAITNETDGAGSVHWEAVGTASKTVKVKDGEIELNDPELAAEGEFHVSYEITSTTNWIDATNLTCSLCSPRASITGVNLAGSGGGTASNCVSSGSVNAGDLERLVGQVSSPGTTKYRLHAMGGGLGGVTYWVTSDSATSSTQVASIAYPTNGEYEVTMTGYASSGYRFLKAFDIDIQDDPNAYWLYPSNTTYISDDGCSHTFLQSFASVELFKGYDDYGDWKTIDFDWGRETSTDWNKMLDYGYQSTRTKNAQPEQYISNLYGALSSAQFKCRAVVGNSFDTDAAAYCGITDWDAKNLLDGIGNWTAGWNVHIFGDEYGAVTTNGESYIEFEFDMGPPPRMTPEKITLYTVTLGISGSADGGEQKYPRSVDTRIKGIIEANWNFPQLHLK